MAKFKTLKDMMIAGQLTTGEVRRMATCLFNDMMPLAGAPEGYTAKAPNFDALPDSCKQFIIKALLEGKVTNILDAQEVTSYQPLAPEDEKWV